MKKNFQLFALGILPILLTGCVLIQSAGSTNAVKGDGEVVASETSASGILHLTSPDSFELEQAALKILKSRCNGNIISTTSRLEMREFIIFQRYTMKMTGICKE